MNKKTRRKKSSRKTRKKQWKPWHFLVIAGVLLLSYLFIFGNHGFIRYYQLYQKKQQLIREIDSLKQQQVELKKEIELLSNNYRYIEKFAREKYQMGKNGEKIYIMTPSRKEKNK